MERITWTVDMSVGMEDIDAQHRELINIINHLMVMKAVGETREAQGRVIARLMDYAQTHFETEERYFREYEYVHREDHEKEHADFIASAFDFKTKFDAGTAGLSDAILGFLSDWLVHHIKGSDKSYAGHFGK